MEPIHNKLPVVFDQQKGSEEYRESHIGMLDWVLRVGIDNGSKKCREVRDNGSSCKPQGLRLERKQLNLVNGSYQLERAMITTLSCDSMSHI